MHGLMEFQFLFGMINQFLAHLFSDDLQPGGPVFASSREAVNQESGASSFFADFFYSSR